MLMVEPRGRTKDAMSSSAPSSAAHSLDTGRVAAEEVEVKAKIMAAKAVFLIAAWTVLYALCFGITYGYNAYFWDNGIAGNLFFAAAGTWLFGVWAAALQVFFSSVSKSSSQVLLGTGGVALGAYLLGIIPKLADLLPVKLMNGTALLQKAADPGDYYGCIVAAGAMVLLCMAAAVACFDRKQL